jgi:hypothetical protein
MDLRVQKKIDDAKEVFISRKWIPISDDVRGAYQ